MAGDTPVMLSSPNNQRRHACSATYCDFSSNQSGSGNSVLASFAVCVRIINIQI